MTEELGTFVSGMRPSDVPSASRDAAKRSVLDLLGAAVAGRSAHSSQLLGELARALFATGPSSIWFSEARRPFESAALANSALASALDVDDGHTGSGGHPGASIIPAVFAVAEDVDASGEEILSAIVLGYEIAVRIAAARDFSKLETFATGRWSAYGVAAAGTWLRRLPPTEMAEALAIAGVHAPDLSAAGYTSRRGHSVKEGIPWSSLTGLTAIRLAERGFTGPIDILDNPRLFDAAKIRDGLGERFTIESVYFKPYSSCRWIHAATDALVALRRDHELLPEDVLQVHVFTFRRALLLSNSPTPWSFEAAQYSIPFCLAVVMHEGTDALLPLSTDLIGRSDLAAFGAKVQIHVDPALDALFPAKAPARVVLETRRGQFEKRVDDPLGEPSNPMTWMQLEDKFRRLVVGYWSPETANDVIEAVHSLERDGFTRLMPILRSSGMDPTRGHN